MAAPTSAGHAHRVSSHTTLVGSTASSPCWCSRTTWRASTVRLWQRVTKGPGSRAAGIAMAFKLIEPAQRRCRAVNAPHLVALVRAAASFEKGMLVESPEGSGGQQHVA